MFGKRLLKNSPFSSCGKKGPFFFSISTPSKKVPKKVPGTGREKITADFLREVFFSVMKTTPGYEKNEVRKSGKTPRGGSFPGERDTGGVFRIYLGSLFFICIWRTIEGRLCLLLSRGGTWMVYEMGIPRAEEFFFSLPFFKKRGSIWIAILPSSSSSGGIE